MATKITETLDKMIPAIDGYVVEVEVDKTLSIHSGYGFGYTLPEGYVMVTMNDSEGREFYLLAPADLSVTTN